MTHTKHYTTRLAVKSLGQDGTFAGYASVFSQIDRQHDMILPGAFLATLRARGKDIKLLWQHDMGEPIGVLTAMFEDTKGLYIEGKLLLDVSRAREAYALLKAGAISGLSIGYTPVRYRLDPDSGVRLLTEVELWEVSLVTFPANEQATVTQLKTKDSDIGKLCAAVSYAYAALKGTNNLSLHQHRDR